MTKHLLPDEFSSIEDYTATICEFLLNFKHLFVYEPNKHVIQIFINNDYEKRLPQDWRDALEKISERDLLEMVYYGKSFHHFPDSLKYFIKKCHSLYLKGTISTNRKETTKLHGEITRGMNAKKKYEVEKLAELIVQVSKDTNCDTVIDIGSGKGYLSHVLAHEYDLNVLGIDNKEIVTLGAAQRKKQIEKNTKKETKFQPITSHLSLDLNVPQFLEILSPLKTKKERMVLIGLHTCGDLASTILKLYVNMPLCKALINVGCCYHLLTENGNNVNVGFPLSKFVQKYGISLTSGGRTLGVTMMEHWSPEEDNLEWAYYHQKRHAFRCVLEHLLYTKNQSSFTNKELNRGCFVVPKVPARDCETFDSYAMTALTKIAQGTKKQDSNSPKITPEFKKWIQNECNREYLSEYYKKFHPNKDGQIHKINIFWCVRTLLGPLVEALVLFDRVLFLKEHVKYVELIRLFDSSISPRGLVIISNKE